MIRTLWALVAIAIAAAVSLGIIKVLSSKGPVVEVVDGPFSISTKIPYQGVLSYRVFTRRIKSCDGNVLYTFTRNDPDSTVVITRPIVARDVSPKTERSVSIELPDSVYTGVWRFQSIEDSRCPIYSRQDIIADFEIEVLLPD